MDFASIGFRQTTDVFRGVVASAVATNKTLSVTVNGTTVVARIARDLTVGVGDVVLMMRESHSIFVVARLYAAAPPPPDPEDQSPPPAPEPVTRYGKSVFAPVETRSYRPGQGWRSDNDDIYQGQYGGNGNHTGCAFYGNGPRSLKGATVTSASIRAKRTSGGDYARRQSTLYRITNKTRPSGAPDRFGSSTNGPYLAVGSSDTTISIPTSFAQDLVDGNAGGLAIYDSGGDPYIRLEGRADYGSSFVLTINWKRDS